MSIRVSPACVVEWRASRASRTAPRCSTHPHPRHKKTKMTNTLQFDSAVQFRMLSVVEPPPSLAHTAAGTIPELINVDAASRPYIPSRARNLPASQVEGEEKRGTETGKGMKERERERKVSRDWWQAERIEA